MLWGWINFNFLFNTLLNTKEKLSRLAPRSPTTLLRACWIIIDAHGCISSNSSVIASRTTHPRRPICLACRNVIHVSAVITRKYCAPDVFQRRKRRTMLLARKKLWKQLRLTKVTHYLDERSFRFCHVLTWPTSACIHFLLENTLSFYFFFSEEWCNIWQKVFWLHLCCNLHVYFKITNEDFSFEQRPTAYHKPPSPNKHSLNLLGSSCLPRKLRLSAWR